MLVSHSKRFIYLKTRKTGGTSVEVALEYHARPEGGEASQNGETAMLETEVGIVGARSRDASRYRFYNHMPASAVRDALPAEVWRDYVKICNIRNPWDKVVSKFHWIERMKGPRAKDVVVTSFRDWVGKTDDLGDDLGIYTIDGELIANRVIRYHNLQADFDVVCGELGISRVELPKMKTKARGRAERIPYVDYYDDATREIVAAKFASEIRLFGWSFGENL